MTGPQDKRSSFGLSTVSFAIGCQLMLLAVAMLPSMAVDYLGGSADWAGFLAASAITFVTGSLLVLTTLGTTEPLPLKSAFALTSLSWLAAAFFGAIPFELGPFHLSLADALFESISGLTTTGSTVITGLDTAPHGLLLWRSSLQWLGGIGIVVTALVMLPFLRVGGMQLFRTESSDRSEKLLPSMTSIVRQIVAAYVVLTLACALSLFLVGFTAFEAVNHAFTTLATGGFSTRDTSVGGFANPAAEWIMTLFMAAAALPFMRYVAVANGRPELLLRDSQVRTFFGILGIAILVLASWLVVGLGRPWPEALRAAAFNATSVMTTTGFASEDYTLWGAPAIAFFLALTIVGGCTGSTAGGIKIFRFEILWTSARLYVMSLFLPSRVSRPRYAGRPVDTEIIVAVLSFVFFFMGTWGLTTVLMGALGADLVTAISASATALANVGPGLGPLVGPAGNFQPLTDPMKWLLSVAMLLGRLEFFTVLVLLHPDFWRR